MPATLTTRRIADRKTTTGRSVRWQAHHASEGCACDGTLFIEDECRGKRRCRTYNVTEVIPGKGFARVEGRCFRLEKTDGGATYDLMTGPNGTCDCPAGAYADNPCCHVLAMRELIAQGDIPDPRCDPLPQAARGVGTTCPSCACRNLEDNGEGIAWCPGCFHHDTN